MSITAFADRGWARDDDPGPPERVFAAVTDQTLLESWFVRRRIGSADSEILDDIGRMSMSLGGSRRSTLNRIVIEFDERPVADGETILTLTLTPDGAGTQVVSLTQASRLAQAGTSSWRAWGWDAPCPGRPDCPPQTGVPIRTASGTSQDQTRIPRLRISQRPGRDADRAGSFRRRPGSCPSPGPRSCAPCRAPARLRRRCRSRPDRAFRRPASRRPARRCPWARSIANSGFAPEQ